MPDILEGRDIRRGNRPQLRVPSNCLPKTQVYAKLKGDVYGLTPAQCRKVKRRVERFELKPR